jgi:hypothetical protein
MQESDLNCTQPADIEACIQEAVACHCEQVTAELRSLVEDQRLAVAQLQQLSENLISACDRLQSGTEQSELGQDWHERMIVQNQDAYTEIVQITSSLTEEVFPTQRTWYGEKWRALTLPFRAGRFPQLSERDQLLILLEELGNIGPHHERLFGLLRKLDYPQ